MDNEEILDESFFADGKVFTKGHIIWAAVLGGPLAIAYMFSSNFKVFKQQNMVLRAWLVAFSIYLGVIYLSSVFPLLENLPSIFYTLAFAFISNRFFMIYQAFLADDHISKGGSTQSGFTVFLVILFGFIATIGLVLGVMYLMDPEGLRLIWEEVNRASS